MQSSHRFVLVLLKQIVDRAFPGETSAQRAQQVAVLLTIWAYDRRGEPLTAQRLSEIYGFEPGQTSKLIKRLLERGLIERERTIQDAGFGRGVMYLLRVRETDELKALKAELERRAYC